MSIPVTPDTKLKRPLPVILMGETVTVFRHEKGSSCCVVERPDGTSVVAALCNLDLVGKQRKPINKVSSKPKADTPVKKGKDKEMNAFFDSLADKIPFNCSNCRKPLYALSKFAKRCVCSHILPKEIFKTIATDPDNIYFLGVDFIGCPCDCHDRWGKGVDHRMDKDLERVYEMSIKRYNEKLKFRIPADQISAAEEYLGLRTKSQNLLKDIQDGKEGVRL